MWVRERDREREISGVKDFWWNVSHSFTQKNVVVLAVRMYTLPKFLSSSACLGSDNLKLIQEVLLVKLSCVCVTVLRYQRRSSDKPILTDNSGASLVAQWLRICLLMQGTRVQALVWEDLTCHGATRPVSHNYWACASRACAPQQERPR